MFLVSESPLPEDALLGSYARDPSHYTDCYSVDLPGQLELGDALRGFYATWLFQAERLILRMAGMPKQENEIEALASGASETFAAWRVESRSQTQILLRDTSGHTGSWFMVAPEGAGTRFYFGSVVLARGAGEGEAPKMGWLFKLLLGPHKFYAQALLALARRKILTQ